MVPVLSYNYARAAYHRCRDTMKCAAGFSLAVMAVGAAAFLLAPGVLIRIFSGDAEVLALAVRPFLSSEPAFCPRLSR